MPGGQAQKIGRAAAWAGPRRQTSIPRLQDSLPLVEALTDLDVDPTSDQTGVIKR